MKLFKKSFKIILVTLFSVLVLLIIYLQYSKPIYKGTIKLKNIQSSTTVYFDDFGVPHIYANTQKEAMIALGYVHAQDRLWQMELLKRIAPGRLSEIFGSVMLKNDCFFAGLGIDEDSDIAIASMDTNSETYQLTMAYLDGVNQYIECGKTPIEFQILGIKKEKLTLKDVYNIFGFMSFSFAMAQKTDPLLTDIRDQLGSKYLADFGINGELGTKQLQNFEGKSKQYAEISRSVAAMLDNSPVPPFIGSNSWVLGAEKTKNGKVIFENDPHIGFSQPGTWYEAHICTPNYEMYGFHLAGTPFPLLGHNRNFAYGLTMFENDDLDFFEEKDNPKNSTQYQTVAGFENYTFTTKTIKVKDSLDVVLKIKSTVRGPIISGLIDGLTNKKPVSLSWIYTHQKNQILDAVYGMSHAKNLDGFQKGIELIAAPGLNIMYGDAKDNIAWITSGKLYKMPKTVNPNFILNGTNGIDDKKEFLTFSQHPKAINPPWNYVYSSNNQPQATANYLYPGYYLPKDRAERIDELLVSKNNWTKKEVCRMTLDNTSKTQANNAKIICDLLYKNNLSDNETTAISVLNSWKGTNNETDIAPTIYNKIIYFYLKNTFEDELGTDKFSALLSTHIIKQTIENLLMNPNSPWWDNVKTKNKSETRTDIISQSVHQAIESLQNQFGKNVSSWTWNTAHTLEIGHPLGKVAALKPFFNVSPTAIAGTSEVINNLMFTFSNNKINEVKAGPSARRVIDFSDIENALSILPSGQSGNPMSAHYSDQAQMYAKGKFRKMKLNKNEIIKTSTKLVFIPAK